MTTAQPDAKKPRRTPLYTFARGVAWVLFHTVIPIRYHNAEKLNRADAPYILIANHLSFIDPGVAEPLIAVQDKLDRFPMPGGRRPNP